MLVEGFGGCSASHGLAGAGAERVSDGREFFGGPRGKIGPLRKVLAETTISVLVSSSLPRRMRIGEVHKDTGLDLELSLGLSQTRSDRAVGSGPKVSR